MSQTSSEQPPEIAEAPDGPTVLPAASPVKASEYAEAPGVLSRSRHWIQAERKDLGRGLAAAGQHRAFNRWFLAYAAFTSGTTVFSIGLAIGIIPGIGTGDASSSSTAPPEPSSFGDALRPRVVQADVPLSKRLFELALEVKKQEVQGNRAFDSWLNAQGADPIDPVIEEATRTRAFAGYEVAKAKFDKTALAALNGSYKDRDARLADIAAVFDAATIVDELPTGFVSLALAPDTGDISVFSDVVSVAQKLDGPRALALVTMQMDDLTDVQYVRAIRTLVNADITAQGFAVGLGSALRAAREGSMLPNYTVPEIEAVLVTAVEQQQGHGDSLLQPWADWIGQTDIDKQQKIEIFARLREGQALGSRTSWADFEVAWEQSRGSLDPSLPVQEGQSPDPIEI